MCCFGKNKVFIENYDKNILITLNILFLYKNILNCLIQKKYSVNISHNNQVFIAVFMTLSSVSVCMSLETEFVKKEKVCLF